MEHINLNCNVGSVDDSISYIDSFDYSIEDPDNDTQIIAALNKSLKRLKMTKQEIVIGFVEVFHNKIKIAEIGVMKIGKIDKNYISRI